MTQDLILFIAGLFISWFLTHIYHVIGNRHKNLELAQNRLFHEKLSEDGKDVILKSNKDNLTILELGALLKDRVKDFNNPEYLNYKACPVCSSQNLFNDPYLEVDSELGDSGEIVHSPTFIPMVKCHDCGWSKRINEKDIFD